jgi:hypothetical protein
MAPAARRRATCVESCFARLSFEDQRAARVDQAGGVLEVLHAQRHAFERTRLAARDALAGGLRVGEQGMALAHGDEGVEIAVGHVDAVEHRLHELDRRGFLRPQ